MRLDVEHHVQVAGRSAALASFAVARRAEARTGVHPCWDAQLDARSPLAPPRAPANFARFLYDAPGALAVRTGLGDAENAARADHLAASAAGGANPRARAGFGSRTRAVGAPLRLRNGDFLFAAVGGFLEGKFQVVTQVVAALGLGWVRPAPAEKVLEDAAAAKDFAEDLEGIVETGPASERAAIESGVAVLIVGGAFPRSLRGLPRS